MARQGMMEWEALAYAVYAAAGYQKTRSKDVGRVIIQADTG